MNKDIKDILEIKDKQMNKIKSDFQKKINKTTKHILKLQKVTSERKKQAIKDHNTIREFKKLLYSEYPNLTNKIKQNKKAKVRKRDKNSCAFCKRNVFEINPDNTIHHIIPKHLTNDDSPENLITLCEECHTTLELKIYRGLIKYFKEKLEENKKYKN